VTVTVPEGADVRAAVYAREDRWVVIVANWDRQAREVGIALRPEALPGADRGVVWRDLDPGLTPPKAVVASQEEMQSVAHGSVAMIERGGGQSLTAEALTDLLEGTSPAGRAQDALQLRAVGQAAHVLVRPRDYRVLEARPER